MKKITLFLLVTLLVFSGFSPLVKAETNEKRKEIQSPRSEWMKGKYGLMVHWITPNFDPTKNNKNPLTPLPEKGSYKNDLNDAVNGFDVKRFMKDFDKTGAEWLIFTIGQNSGTYASPNSVIDSL